MLLLLFALDGEGANETYSLYDLIRSNGKVQGTYRVHVRDLFEYTL